jgi:hypothetical protein
MDPKIRVTAWKEYLSFRQYPAGATQSLVGLANIANADQTRPFD